MADFKNTNKRNFNRNKNNNRGDYGNKKDIRVAAPEVCAGTIEYKMGRQMADSIIKESKSKRAPQEILCNYVNTQCGLKGYCVKVIVEL